VAKLIETTELTGGLTSFRTDIGPKVDTLTSLGERYQHYKDLLKNEDQANTANKTSDTTE
jgi:hypothetical protein